MKLIRLIAVLGLGFGVSACANVETATRNAPLEMPATVESVAPSFQVTGYNVRVPETLRVSEAELFYPLGDIVWRGDPMGDRYEQIEAIFNASILNGIEGLDGFVPVVLDIEVLRFHALTNKARYTIGGVHSIKFNLTLRDPETGAILVPERLIEANLKAFGGQKAILADRRGQTQKVRITGHLAQVIEQALTTPAEDSVPLVAAAEETLAPNQI